MATIAQPNGINGITQSTQQTHQPEPLQLSIPLPNSAPGSRINLHLTLLSTSLLLFLTTSTSDSVSSSGPASLGSFVYAMPDRYNPTTPLSTALYTLPSTQDFATRLAKILARRTNRAVYVGSSVSFAGAGNGGTVEEEMEGFRRVVETVVSVVSRSE